MYKIILLLSITILASCTPPPRTADELRSGQGSAMGLSRTETHNINREFSLVVNDVKKKSAECLQFAYSQTTTHGGIVTSQGTKFYNSKVKTIKPGKAEMTMQWDRLPRADHDPDGGYYVFLVDIEKTAANKTGMNFYGSTFSTWDPIFAAIKSWGEGKNIACPESP